MIYRHIFIFLLGVLTVLTPVIADECPAGYRYNSEYEKYTELEYIESTGTQWIDTGVVPNNNSKIDIDYYFPPLESGFFRAAVIGYRFGNWDTTNGFNIYQNHSSGQEYRQIKIGVGWPSGVQNISNITTDRNHTIIDFKNKTATNNGVAVADASIFINWKLVNMNLCTKPLLLFAIVEYDNGDNLISSKGPKIYSAKFYNNSTLVRNFIPVKRNSDGEIGMYDLVNDVFYTNSGTGTFIAGPVVVGGALASQCLVCPPNTYKSTVGNDTQCTPCPNSYISPTGSTDVSDCGRVLHLGNNDIFLLRATRQTTPSLHVQDNDGNEWYGNLYHKE